MEIVKSKRVILFLCKLQSANITGAAEVMHYPKTIIWK